jgi:Animal haem peroxidase
VTYLKDNGVQTLWHSMLRFPAGALKLNNYPATLRKIVPEIWTPDGKIKHLAPTDMAAMEIYRDRERGVPRYNEFRKWCAQNQFKVFLQLPCRPFMFALLICLLKGFISQLL